MDDESTPFVQVAPGLRIPRSELHLTFSRSPGPGGQNVNKVNTRVTLRFDVAQSPSLNAGQKSGIRSKLATRIDSTGVMRVVSSRHRTQAANRRAVVERFAELLAAALARPKRRIKTRIPRASRERRLQEKARRSETKRQRRQRPAVSGD